MEVSEKQICSADVGIRYTIYKQLRSYPQVAVTAGSQALSMTAAVVNPPEVENAADYRVAPPYAEKFKESEARTVIQACLQRRLTDARYHPDNTSTWAKEIADDVKQEMKEKGWLRYKFIVHVVRQTGLGLEFWMRCRLCCASCQRCRCPQSENTSFATVVQSAVLGHSLRHACMATWQGRTLASPSRRSLERGSVGLKVQVIGEQKGEAIKVACKCFWDSKTDAFAKETFENKSIFAVATVYGVYYY